MCHGPEGCRVDANDPKGCCSNQEKGCHTHADQDQSTQESGGQTLSTTLPSCGIDVCEG